MVDDDDDDDEQNTHINKNYQFTTFGISFVQSSTIVQGSSLWRSRPSQMINVTLQPEQVQRQETKFHFFPI